MAKCESVERSGKRSEPLSRLARARPRHWPVDVKRRIVEETLVPGASVSVVARRHDVNANQLFKWLVLYRRGELGQGTAEIGAVPLGLIQVGVVKQGKIISSTSAVKPLSLPAPSIKTSSGAECASVPVGGRRAGMIEIALRGGIKVRVGDDIDEAALRRVLSVVRELA
jgi:transposase